MGRVHLATLLYGDYPDLARHVLTGILFKGYPVIVGFNEVSDRTLQVVSELTGGDVGRAASSFGETHYRVLCAHAQCHLPDGYHVALPDPQSVTIVSAGNQNILKYPMQRRMFSALPKDAGVIWLDDDVVFPAADPDKWLTLFTSALDDGFDYVGEPFFCQAQGNQLKWAKSRAWWRNKMPARSLAIPFFRGGVLGLSARFRSTLDWPDVDIGHNGGEVMSGLAAAQFPELKWKSIRPRETGLTFFHPRRGVSEDPVGKYFSP